MKVRNREINIFSMSALDLFASGMGAFILLAVIALPFFGNVSSVPTDAPLQCPKPEICPKPVPCQVCPPPSPPGFQKAAKLDLVVVLDITGSMDKKIAGLKSEISGISQLLERLTEGANLRLVVFGDVDFDRPITHFPLTPVSDQQQLAKQLEQVVVDVGMGAGNNNATGESVYAGFVEALRTKWSSDAEQRVILILTDDEPHGGEHSQLTKQVTKFAAQNSLYTVSVQYSGSDADEVKYYQQLTTAGHGQYLPDGSLTAALVLAILPK